MHEPNVRRLQPASRRTSGMNRTCVLVGIFVVILNGVLDGEFAAFRWR
jgi:hypothetical protein